MQVCVAGKEWVDGRDNRRVDPRKPQGRHPIDMRGALVFIDAMGCQIKIVQLIRDSGGGYLSSRPMTAEQALESVRDHWEAGYSERVQRIRGAV